jgi:intracellular sulfur oxidation DsrE/DsrF family protein
MASKISFRVIFDMNEASNAKLKAALAEMQHLREHLGRENVGLEMVAHSDGIGALLRKDNPEAETIERLARDGVVHFAACDTTMADRGISADDLLDVAEVVPSGITEVVHRQSEGWYYIHP